MIEVMHLEAYLEAKDYSSQFTDTNKLMAFEKGYNLCMEHMEKGKICALNFWALFLKNMSISAPEVSKVGAKYARMKRRSMREGNKLMAIYPNNLHFLIKYMVFQNGIIHNESYALEIMEKMKRITDWGSVRSEELRGSGCELSSYSQMRMIKISIEGGNIGEITDASMEVESLIGYTSSELIGRNIETLMPPNIALCHLQYTKAFLDTMNFHCLYIDFPVLLRHKTGFYLPAYINKKLIPTIGTDQNFAMLGFLSPHNYLLLISQMRIHTKCASMIVLSDLSGKVLGISKECSTYLGISPSILGDESLGMRISKLLSPYARKAKIRESLSENSGSFCILHINIPELTQRLIGKGNMIYQSYIEIY